MYIITPGQAIDMVLEEILGTQIDSVKGEPLTYQAGVNASKKNDKMLMTYVGFLPKQKQENAIVCYTDSLPGFPAKCIVISTHEKGQHIWLMTLNPDGSEYNVRTNVPVIRTQSC